MSLQLISDNPIINWKNDVLYKDFVENIFNEIVNLKKENTPFVIGINWRWGTWKTSIMKILKNKIDTKEARNITKNNIYLTVWFESWKYNDFQSIWNSLIYHIFKSLSLNKKVLWLLQENPEKVRKMFSYLEELPKIWNLFKVWWKIYDDFKWVNSYNPWKLVDFEQYFIDFLKLIWFLDTNWNENRKDNNKIVIFVDDLDRCSKDALLSFFEYIKLHINIPWVIFVIWMDKENVIKELSWDENKKHDEEYYKEYLEKIVQHWYDVPKLSLVELEKYLKSFINDKDILELLIKKWLLIEFKNYTPRKIKQIINKYIEKTNKLTKAIENNQITKEKIFILSFLDVGIWFINEVINDKEKLLLYKKDRIKSVEDIDSDTIENIYNELVKLAGGEELTKKQYDKLSSSLKKLYTYWF